MYYPPSLTVRVPIRTGTGQNDREHYMARARRVKAEREAVAWRLKSERPLNLPAVITLTRFAPSNGLDSDNLQGSLKAVRDQVAEWLGVDDKELGVVAYEYRQKRGPWEVSIKMESR